MTQYVALKHDDVIKWKRIPRQQQDRYHFVHAPSQWEMTLHWNVIAHWLGAYTKWSLQVDTLDYRYIAVIYNAITHTGQHCVTMVKLRQDFVFTNTTHISPSRASYGVSFVRSSKNNDRDIARARCTYQRMTGRLAPGSSCQSQFHRGVHP